MSGSQATAVERGQDPGLGVWEEPSRGHLTRQGKGEDREGFLEEVASTLRSEGSWEFSGTGWRRGLHSREKDSPGSAWLRVKYRRMGRREKRGMRALFLSLLQIHGFVNTAAHLDFSLGAKESPKWQSSNTMASGPEIIPPGCYLALRWPGPANSWGHRLGQQAEVTTQVLSDSGPKVLGGPRTALGFSLGTDGHREHRRESGLSWNRD